MTRALAFRHYRCGAGVAEEGGGVLLYLLLRSPSAAAGLAIETLSELDRNRS